ncbi:MULTISPECIES: response regulator [Nostoc]|uniref:Response regulator n=1 Tax=Nostoc paludosum FACHB-159 TaxID=2692908 RepID=A0ABR8K993_9NOSO|nr:MULTISPECIES: response regulator [Nostoc]MBD2678661.1 response regulator [Nostoc sp. FACHB-857]MBD2734712.1 response regulator [Nostoc paludosum FACHB-159]
MDFWWLNCASSVVRQEYTLAAFALVNFLPVLLVTVILVRWLSRSLVVLPVLQLNSAAKQLTIGNWNATLPSDRTDELGELSASFNSMAKQLQTSFATLEQKVEERTLELAEAKEKADTANQAKDWATTPRTTEQGKIIGFEGSQRQVVVVDDRWENRSVLVSLLEPLGFAVMEVSNGREGLAKAKEIHPDVIITDLMMPEMNGYEMLRELRQIPELKHVPAIASSASVFLAIFGKQLQICRKMFEIMPVLSNKGRKRKTFCPSRPHFSLSA